ncbi:beta-1,4-mannanase [Lujinxingia vulgaris]|uniref:Beta-1,4-mannanase n=1 Tax=Lujinxingia vulgaris TaxID=2600176 RepID=A0A5C6X7Z3_9DELT|nr:Z1 domain-containing protein [Lujinxingia vulgaris]TXD37965.1 beta-1,4-mannanase [Lujinxingia vulgaris]
MAISVDFLKEKIEDYSVAKSEPDYYYCAKKVVSEFLTNQFTPVTPEQAQKINVLATEAVEKIREEVGEIFVIGEPIPLGPLPPISMAQHWNAYKQHLLKNKGWDANTVKGLENATQQIVTRLPDPRSESNFQGRGLVLGYVQSGKTANMMGVIARAADRGWNFVLILAGLTNVLRYQTQSRFEADLYKHNRHYWDRLTTNDGDFDDSREEGFKPLKPGIVRIAIVKKNLAVLKKLKKRFKETHSGHKESFNVLVIDDECDHASVNASNRDDGITAINQAIREMLALMPRHAYVGYTATPFANVLIDPSVDPTKPEDLYPRDFILSLQSPKAYFGTDRLFGQGLIDAEELDEPGAEGMNVIRIVPENDAKFLSPPKKKKGERLRDVWDTLALTTHFRRSLDWFLMATAVRELRGQESEHSSMLIHTAIRVEAHRLVAQKVQNEIESIRQALVRDDEQLLARWRELYEQEIDAVPAHEFKNARFPFEKVVARVSELLERANEPGALEIIIENGQSDNRLDFEVIPNSEGRPFGRRYLVVGGVVLARGLTIEGLTASYFLRPTKQYDTLMQMGRWFGYRKGYEDLQRIWMPQSIIDRFQKLATVEAEIREDIASYVDPQGNEKKTPLDFAVRIRQIPGMMITARGKMRSVRKVRLSWSNQHIQTRRFHHKNEAFLASNRAATVELLNELDSPVDVASGRVWLNVPVTKIQKFLNNYEVHEHHDEFHREQLDEFISKLAKRGINTWNVAIAEPKKGKVYTQGKGALEGTRMVNRAAFSKLADGEGVDIKSLMSKTDVFLDVKALDSDTPKMTDRRRSWNAYKQKRQDAFEHPVPMLVLYIIDPDSTPKSDSGKFKNLNANSPVIGLGIIFPDLKEHGAEVYVEVALPEIEEDDFEEYEDDNE